MSRFLLDTTTHRPVRSGGSFVRVTGAQEIAQNVKVRLLLFLGEVWLDTTQGVPYFQEVLLKGVDPAALQVVFREAILGADGIVSIELLELAFDPATRVLTVDYQATGTLDELAEDLKVEDTLEIPL